MLGQRNIRIIWHLSRSFPDKFVMYGVTIESPIESPMVSPTILNSPDGRVQDQPYRGYLYPPKTNYISRSPWPGTTKIYNALQACEKLRIVSLICSKKKCIFADYRKQVTYACVGPQVLKNSQNVLDYAPFLEKLPEHHWDSLNWLMWCAEMCFEMIADHQVISHLHHAKKVVPF